MDLQTLELKRNKLLLDADVLLKNAERENRGLTPEETKSYEQWLDRDLPNVKSQIANLARDDEQRAAIKRLENGVGLTPTTVRLARGKSLGEQFTDSAAFKYLVETKSNRPP